MSIIQLKIIVFFQALYMPALQEFFPRRFQHIMISLLLAVAHCAFPWLQSWQGAFSAKMPHKYDGLCDCHHCILQAESGRVLHTGSQMRGSPGTFYFCCVWQMLQAQQWTGGAHQPDIISRTLDLILRFVINWFSFSALTLLAMIQIQNILRDSNKYYFNRINTVIIFVNDCFSQTPKIQMWSAIETLLCALPAQLLFHLPGSKISKVHCNTNLLTGRAWEVPSRFSGWQNCSICQDAQGCLPASCLFTRDSSFNIHLFCV